MGTVSESDLEAHQDHWHDNVLYIYTSFLGNFFWGTCVYCRKWKTCMCLHNIIAYYAYVTILTNVRVWLWAIYNTPPKMKPRIGGVNMTLMGVCLPSSPGPFPRFSRLYTRYIKLKEAIVYNTYQICCCSDPQCTDPVILWFEINGCINMFACTLSPALKLAHRVFWNCQILTASLLAMFSDIAKYVPLNCRAVITGWGPVIKNFSILCHSYPSFLNCLISEWTLSSWSLG